MHRQSFGTDDGWAATGCNRLSIHLLLNPITPRAAYPASQLVLPSIETLDLPLTLLPHHPLPPHPHPRQRPYPRRRPSSRASSTTTTSTSTSSTSPPSSPRSPLSPTKHTPHSNLAYTLDQMHFIQYLREDKRLQWRDIVAPYNAQFPGHHRARGALECRYYRAQQYPTFDAAGGVVCDAAGDVVMGNVRVRQRRENSGRVEAYIKLVDRCPHKVLEYPWAEEADKMRARRISRFSPAALD